MGGVKGWKTVGSNVILFLVFALGWEPLTEYVSAEWIASMTAALNVGLRFLTTTPVFKKDEA